MSEIDQRDGINRRKVLECMTWCGTGVLWTIAGGVPHSLGIMGEAQAAESRGLTFLQISDSHVGFDKPANPNALSTLEEAIAKVNALPEKPAFMTTPAISAICRKNRSSITPTTSFHSRGLMYTMFRANTTSSIPIRKCIVSVTAALLR